MVLRRPGLIHKDEQRVHDELAHTGLRALFHHVATGRSPEDALFEASAALKGALERASRELPSEEDLEPFFLAACRKLKLRRVDERLSYIARETGRLAGAADLTEETRQLIEERIELLEFKRKLL
jgi:DNA primase